MSRGLLRSWRLPAFAPAVFPERPDAREGNVLDRLLAGLLGRWAQCTSRFRQRQLRRIAGRVEALAEELERLESEELRHRAAAVRLALLRDGLLDAHVVTCFALIREVTRRLLGKRHYLVQLMGGYALLQGMLAEMQTGEGKTLTALLPAVTVALAGIPVHVITVNAYLATRDANELAAVYGFFGLRVGLLVPEMDAADRTRAYGCEVTYCVNKDLVFDYLRDRLRYQRGLGGERALLREWLSGKPAGADGESLLRGLFYAIVDEADCVLIDEARTPLIISRDVADPYGRTLYEEALAVAASLDLGEHFQVRGRERSVELLPAGRAAVTECAAGRCDLWAFPLAREELVEQGLSALYLFDRDRHYLITDGKVQIIDEYTGRVMADRSWERGLHQMIEVKEGLPLSDRRDTVARITYQRFFRRYLWAAGMTGTATEVAAEMRVVYGLDVLRIPPNRPVVRSFLGHRVFLDSERRWASVVERAAEMRAAGRALLIGTRSVKASELVSARLDAAGLEHVVLNARQDVSEAEIVRHAGQSGRITVATNMAGRGTDIVLSPEVRAAGGLHVILSEYHEAARIDRQLFGRAGRQGDPGSCEALAALDDELFTAHAPRWQSLLRRHFSSCEVLPDAAGSFLRHLAQSAAERQHSHMRRQTVIADLRAEKALAFAGTGE